MIRSGTAECRRPSRITVAERGRAGGWRCRRPARSPSLVAARGRTIRIRCRRSAAPALASRALMAQTRWCRAAQCGRSTPPPGEAHARSFGRDPFRRGDLSRRRSDRHRRHCRRHLAGAQGAAGDQRSDDPCRSVAIAGGLTVLLKSGFADALACDPIIVCVVPGWAAAEDPALCAFPRRRPARVHRLCLHWRVGPGRHRRARWAGCHGPPPSRRGRSELGTVITPRGALIPDADVVIGGDVSLAIDTKPYLIGRIYAETASDEVARNDRAWAANRAALDVETG